MAYQYKLQIPISDELNEKLKRKIQELGFSSISEATRFLLINLVNGNLAINFSSKQTELDKLILEALEEHKQGLTKKLDFSKPLHDQILEDL